MTASLALQSAINTTLRSASPVTALVSTRIYDRVPQNVVFPFVQLGDGQEVDDGFDCGESAVEVFLDVHIWSRAVGKVEAHQIAGAVKSALHRTNPTLSTGWRCVDLMVNDMRTMTETDTLTTHIVVNCQALIDPVA